MNEDATFTVISNGMTVTGTLSANDSGNPPYNISWLMRMPRLPDYTSSSTTFSHTFEFSGPVYVEATYTIHFGGENHTKTVFVWVNVPGTDPIVPPDPDPTRTLPLVLSSSDLTIVARLTTISSTDSITNISWRFYSQNGTQVSYAHGSVEATYTASVYEVFSIHVDYTLNGTPHDENGSIDISGNSPVDPPIPDPDPIPTPISPFTVTVSDKTITTRLPDVRSTDVRTNISWQFSVGESIVHHSVDRIEDSYTATSYDTVSILSNYTLNGIDKGSQQTITLVAPSPTPVIDPTPTLIEDVFSEKPIVFPAHCTGDITLTATITDLVTKDPYREPGISPTISASGNVTDITLEASTSIDFVFGKLDIEDEGHKFGLIASESTIITDLVDNALDNLEYLPAFYNSGNLSIFWTLSSTDEPDDDVDMTWDMKMMCPTDQYPTWYESDLTYDDEVFNNLITGSQQETNLPGIANNTTLPSPSWQLSPFGQIPPFWVKWWIDASKESVEAIKRAVLPGFKYKFTLQNNLAYAVTLNNIRFDWKWSYSEDGTFMNMRTAGDRRSQSSKICTLPKGADAIRTVGLDYPVFALLEGYESGEVIKVYAIFNKWQETISAFYPKTSLLTAIPKADFVLPGDTVYMGDFGDFVYKTSTYDLPSTDYLRITNGNWMAGDKIDVVTPERIAAEEEFRTIEVKVKDDLSIDETAAIIVITVVPNESINSESPITAAELATNISKIHYFNTEYDFAPSIEIPRSDIDVCFRETLWQTYEKAVVLESILSEPLHYVNFSVNTLTNYIPIYNGQQLTFSNTLGHCIDGIRSGEIFYMDGITPNVINIQNPDAHVYKIQFNFKYDLYKDAYVITDEDVAALK